MAEMLFILFALYPLCLCALALVWLVYGRSRWTLRVLASGSIVAFAVLAGSWVYTSYYLRYVALVLFIGALVWSYRRKHAAAVGFVIPLAILAVFGPLAALAFASRHHPGEAARLAFPLASGTYLVLQGGNSVLTNPFHAMSGSPLALDLVKLNRLGNRATGPSPAAPYGYGIFGDTLRSPCAGRVIAARGDLPDSLPGRPDERRKNGNHVVLECAGYEILVAHLMFDSVAVKPDDTVVAGQVLGQVGNSGYSLEPHLHIEARRHGVPAAMEFNGAFLTLNSVVR